MSTPDEVRALPKVALDDHHDERADERHDDHHDERADERHDDHHDERPEPVDGVTRPAFSETNGRHRA